METFGDELVGKNQSGFESLIRWKRLAESIWTDRRIQSGAVTNRTTITLSITLRLFNSTYITPAPRAHLYFAPSTATGSSVVYGYATMPRS